MAVPVVKISNEVELSLDDVAMLLFPENAEHGDYFAMMSLAVSSILRCVEIFQRDNPGVVDPREVFHAAIEHIEAECSVHYA